MGLWKSSVQDFKNSNLIGGLKYLIESRPCSRVWTRSKKTEVAPEPQAALDRVNSMQRDECTRGSSSGIC